MFNLDYELCTVPIPHILIKNFIKDKEVLDFLCHNSELHPVYKRERLGNLERIEMYARSDRKRTKGKFTSILPDDFFSQKFNHIVENVLLNIQSCDELVDIFKKEFTPYMEKEYPGFNETWKKENRSLTYGAYNVTSEAKNLIGWHLDKGDKLIAGFVYLKEDRDKGNDGHLYLSDGSNIQKEVPYVNNTLVVWPNLPNAWHKAGVRYPTKHLRRIINVVVESDNNKYYHDYSCPRSDKVVDYNELYKYKKFGFIKVDKR